MRRATPLFILLLLFSAANCALPASDEGARTFITISSSGQTAYVKISFANASEFHQRVSPSLEQDVGVLMDPSSYESIDDVRFGFAPVAGARLIFSFDGHNLSDSSGNVICNPAIANAKGEANCSFAYHINASGGVADIESQKSCGLLQVRYEGNTSGEVSILPSFQAITACPKNNAALSALGPAISGALSSNAAYCFPAMLVVGLLLASMYYSGRDPLSLFDLTTPRLPKSRQYRLKGPTLPMMINSMIKRVEIQNRKATKSLFTAAREAADMRTRGKSGKDRKEARRQAREQVKEALREYYKETSGGSPLSKEGSERVNAILREILRGRPKDASGRVAKKWDSIQKMGGEGLTHVMAAGDQLVSALKLARGGGSKGYEKWLNNRLDRARKKVVAFDESKGARIIQKIPIVKGVVNLPVKAMDVYMQFRASKIGAKRLGSETGRALAFLAFTKQDKEDAGKRIKNSLGALFQKLSPGKFDEFMKKSDFADKKKNEILDRAEEYRIGLAASTTIMYNQLLALLISQVSTRGSHETREEAIKLVKSALKNPSLTSDQKDTLNSILASLNTSDPNSAKKAFERLENLDKKAFSHIASFLSGIEKREADVSGVIERLNSGTLTPEKALLALASLQKQGPERKKIEEQTGLLAGIIGGLARDCMIYFKNGEFKALTREDVESMRTHLSYEKGNFPLLKKAEAELKALAESGALVANGKKLSPADIEKMKEAERFALLVENRANLPSFRELAKKVDKQIDVIFGEGISKLSAADFDSKAARFKEKYLKDGEAALSQLKGIADSINSGSKAKADESFQERVSRLMKACIFGEGGPLSFYLNDRLKHLGIVSEGGNPYSIKDMDDFDILMRPNSAGRKHFLERLTQAVIDGKLGSELQALYHGELSSAQARLAKGVPPDKIPEDVRRQAAAHAAEAVSARAFVNLLNEGTSFAKQWEARAIGVSELFRPQRGNREVFSILKDPFSAGNLRFLERKAGEGEVAELAAKRAEFRTQNIQYDRSVDEALLRARRWDNMASQAAWHGLSGSTWANFVYSDMSKYLNKAREDRSMLAMFFSQLVNKDSQYYDAKFTTVDMKGKLKYDAEGKPVFNGDAYSELIKRGYTFSDYRRKVGFMLSSDRRGGMVMLEHNQDVLKACGIEDGVYRKGKVVDLAPLISRYESSSYGNRLMNIAILVQHKTPGGDASWIYAHPGKDASTAGIMAFAESNKDLRVLAGMSLTGTQIGGGYDPNAKVKAVTVSDLKYSGKPESQGVFGAGDTKSRNSVIRAQLSLGSALSEFVTAGYETRKQNMRNWYTAQTQARFVLWEFKNELEGETRAGGKRFTFDPKTHFFDKNNTDEYKKIGGSDEQKDLIADRMGKIQSSGGLFSWAVGWNYRRGIAANTLEAIAAEESKYYSAKLMDKALNSLYKDRLISREDYLARKDETKAIRQEYKAAYADAKHEFKALNDIARDWVGTHDSPYGSRRNLVSVMGLFDSGYRQGLASDFFQVAESSVMRDPRVAIGGGYENTMMVGYQTGQNVYERPTFWAINSGWERAMHLPISLASTVHKFQNEFISFGARKGSFYPAYFETDSLNGSKWGTQDKLAIFKALITVPTDYTHARLQNMLDSSTLSVAIGAYMRAGPSDPTKEGIVRRGVRSIFTDSEHYATPALLSGLTRPLDRYLQAERKLDTMLKSDPKMLEVYEEWRTTDDHARKEELWKKYFKPISKIYDSRPVSVREGHSGRDIQEDGSRNRFMELYSAYHNSNYWKPMVPGMIDVSLLTGKYSPFTQIASEVDRASGGPLSVMKHYYSDEYDEKGRWKSSSDRFSTHSDAYRRVYKDDTSLLLNTMKLQAEMMDYSFTNTRTLMLASPISSVIRGLLFKKFRESKSTASASEHAPHYHYAGGRIDANYVYGGGHIDGFDSKFEQFTGHSIDTALVDHSKHRQRRPAYLAMVGTELANGFSMYSPLRFKAKRQAIDAEARAAYGKRGEA